MPPRRRAATRRGSHPPRAGASVRSPMGHRPEEFPQGLVLARKKRPLWEQETQWETEREPASPHEDAAAKMRIENRARIEQRAARAKNAELRGASRPGPHEDFRAGIAVDVRHSHREA